MRLVNADDFISRLDHVPLVQEAIKKAMDCMPTIEERKKGKWIWCGDKHVCSECDEFALCDAYDVLDTGEYQEELTDFCPNCGADMRGNDNG